MSEPALCARSVTEQGTAQEESGGTRAELPPCRATVEVVPDGDRVRVRMRGELDLDGRRLEPVLYEALRHSGSGLDLDLAALEFCDCSGLNILLELRQRALALGKTVVMASNGPQLERLLEVTGTRALFVRPGGPDDDPGTRPGAADDAADQDLWKEVRHLRRAMRTRPTIDLARGMLMAAFGLSPQTAWDVLVATSQHTNTKLHTLAGALVGTTQEGELSETVRRHLAAAVARANAAPTVPRQGAGPSSASAAASACGPGGGPPRTSTAS